MKLVIFDCDGTIADSQHAIHLAMQKAFDTMGLSAPPREEVRTVVGLSLVEAIACLLTEPDRHKAPELAERYKQAFAQLRTEPEHREPLFPGAAELITTLHARDDVLLGIATGKSLRGVERLLRTEGLLDTFSTIQTADNHPSKPHPSMLITAMNEVGVEPERTVMIGDTTFDMDMASSAGVGAIGVAWGCHAPEHLEQSGAHALAQDYASLGKLIDTIMRDRETAA